MTISRRTLLATLLGSFPAVAASESACQECGNPSGWCCDHFQARAIYYRGSGPAIILLHELNGLSPGCIDFGVQLVDAGFTVYMPLLFGHPSQDNGITGYFEACWGSFSCGTSGKDMKIARWLQDFVPYVLARNLHHKGIGVIGMCLSGALPLNVMSEPRVRAVVMSQPALPFGSNMEKQRSLSVSEATMKAAKASGTPILAFRFKQDTISTGARFSFLQDYFGSQFAGTQFDAPPHFHADWTHRLHAVLTGPFPEQRQAARRAVISFMKQQLG